MGVYEKLLKEKNLRLYDKYLNEEHDNSYLKDKLSKIIIFYNGNLTQFFGDNTNINSDLINNNKNDFMLELLPFFNKLAKDNNYQELDKIIDYLFDSDMVWYEVVASLKVIYYPKDFYKENKHEYFNIFKDFCRNTRYVNFNEDYYQFKLAKILELYKKYFDSFMIVNPNDLTKRFFFNKYAPLVIATLYLDKSNLDNINDIFKYMIDNCFVYTNYIDLNKIEDNDPIFDEHFVTKLIYEFNTKKKALIK